MDRKLYILLFIFLPLLSCASAAILVEEENPPVAEKTKLVVGITVDQMRYDYLIRYWDDFSNDGFKRLVGEGFTFRNHHFSYSPTFTGPGHASIFTGTTPLIHGIIANDWFDKNLGKMIYCSSDTSVQGVGGTGYAGQMSPKNLKSSTIGDELKLFSNNRSKVIGISMKDRGAILPAGHNPDGAYWFDGKQNGQWMTSTFYTDALPQWVIDFNQKKLPDFYLAQGWKLLNDETSYDESSVDNNPYESPFAGTLRAAFPYDLEALRANNGNYDLIKATPHGNTLSVDFAIEAMANEGLGQDEFADLLALSFSSTDYVGHQFGPHSREAQDVYLRLDLEIARLLQHLDSEIGKGNYTVFLTADHGGAPVPSLVHDQGWPNDYFSSAPLMTEIDSMLQANYSLKNAILSYSNEQIFLDEKQILERRLNLSYIEEQIAIWAMNKEGVLAAYSSNQIMTGNFNDSPVARIQAGFRPNMSGNVVLMLEPGWMEYGRTGTTHGMAYSYDTHVPFILFGTNIKHGDTYDPSRIRDIAPTIAALLGVPFPSGCTGNPLTQVLEK